MLTSFEQLIDRVKGRKNASRVIVASANDEHTLEAVFRAAEEGIVSPVLVGEKQGIFAILDKLRVSVPMEDVYDIPDPDAAAAKSVELIREGKADFLMKGKLETAQLLKPVVNKETGIGEGGLMTHITLFEAPHYHKLFTAVDGGMVTYPTLEQKKRIIELNVEFFRRLGYENPKVAILAAIEKVNPKMPETVEADELCQMNRRGELSGCTVAGPISLDIALDRESAEIKGYENPVAGDADILVVPNIQTGNILGKSITVIAKGKMSGFIAGAKVPIILTSRASSSEEKYLSIVLASAVSGNSNQ